MCFISKYKVNQVILFRRLSRELTMTILEMNVKKIVLSQQYEKAMLCAVFLYALLSIPYAGVGKAFSLVFTLGSLPLLYVYKERIFKEPMVILLGAAIVTQVLSWCNAYISLPNIVASGPHIDRLAKLFLFVFVAYWLKGSQKNTYILWGLFLVGFTIGCFVHADFFQQLQAGLGGQRVDFGIKNAQYTTMFSGLGVLLCSHFLWVLYNQGNYTLSRYSLMMLCCASLILFLVITVISQSRMVWLALVAVLFVAPIAYQKFSVKKQWKKVAIGYVAILLLGGLLSQVNVIKHRTVGTESGTFSHIIAGDFDNIPMTSIGIRVNTWLEATKWIKERPILGGDSNAIKFVIENSDRFSEQLKSQFKHLHNFHIETLVAYGFLGLVIIYSVYIWLFKSLLIASYKDKNINPFLPLTILFIIYWFVVNGFETFNSRTYGVLAHNIMCGGIYTFYFYHYLTKKE